jgi:hypothetical protein
MVFLRRKDGRSEVNGVFNRKNGIFKKKKGRWFCMNMVIFKLKYGVFKRKGRAFCMKMVFLRGIGVSGLKIFSVFLRIGENR